MVSRSRRRVIAPLVSVAIVFAQLALTAHACAFHGSATLLAAAHAASRSEVVHHPCTESTAAPKSPQANTCEVHCTDGATLPVSPDVPSVTLAALPVPEILLVARTATERAARASTTALPGAPPAAIAFCRLLI